jgi:hypothetical protein
MSFVMADRVMETTDTTGTETIDLAGAEEGYQSFVGGIGDGNETYYCLVDPSTGDWEIGVGTVTDASPDTLSRDDVRSSSNSGSAVSFSAGTKYVFCAHNADGTAYFDSDNRLPVRHSSGDTMWISHDGDDCKFETGAGAFVFIPDSTLFSDATAVVEVRGVGTGRGRVRVYDDGTEYLDILSESGHSFIENKTDGGSAGELHLQYSGNGDVEIFAGASGNQFLRVYGYDSGASAVKQALVYVDSAGRAIFGSSSGEDIRIAPQSSATYATLFQADGDVWMPADLNVAEDLDIGGVTEISVTNSSFTEGVITQGGVRVFHTYEASGTSGNNLFVGANSGTGGLTGTTGNESSYNVGVGYNTLTSLEDGENNVAIGTSAGNALTSGSHNLLIGFAAGNTMNTGTYNVMFGYYSGLTMTSGTYNVGIGPRSLSACTTGDFNVGIGYYAARGCATSDYSVGVGFYSLYGAYGGKNTAIGASAGRTLSNGSGNTFIGYAAGYDASNQSATCHYTIAVGYGADTGGNYAIAIGYNVSAPAGEVVIGDASNITKTTLRGKLTGLSELGGLEKSADPSAPSEGEFTIWMSDGTGKGDDGDILIAVTAGGSTKWKTLFDFDSEGSSW